jgi:hypothetical protein
MGPLPEYTYQSSLMLAREGYGQLESRGSALTLIEVNQQILQWHGQLLRFGSDE